MKPKILNLVSAFLIFGLPWFFFSLFNLRQEHWDIGTTIFLLVIQLLVLLVVQIIAHFRTKTTSYLRLGALGLAWVLLAGVKLYIIQNDPSRQFVEHMETKTCQMNHIKKLIPEEEVANWYIDKQYDGFDKYMYVHGTYEEVQDSLYTYRSYLLYARPSKEGYEIRIAGLRMPKEEHFPIYSDYPVETFQSSFPNQYEEFKFYIDHVIPKIMESKGGIPHPCKFSIQKESGNSGSE
ncbi:MAG: hypothetical protein EP332_06080 [Bacteroidetes bacterium]|nr:MAG: hypothetical protein EP332_06080 [Bacteroidota bacterium]